MAAVGVKELGLTVDGSSVWLADRVSSVLRPRQHSIGYMGDGLYRLVDRMNVELHVHVCCVMCCVDENSCDPRAYCPPQCKCSGTEVRCSHRQLTALPELLPLDTTEL